MPRISDAQKKRYRTVTHHQAGVDADTCYYCDAQAVMDELTPSPSATPMDMETFTGEWVLVRCCKKCYARIYTQNVAGGGVAFGVRKGLMTLAQKVELIRKIVQRSVQFVLGHDKLLVVPIGIMQIDEHRYAMGPTTFFREELEDMQGAMCTRIMSLPESVVEAQLSLALGGGNLDYARIAEYRQLLGLPNEAPQ